MKASEHRRRFVGRLALTASGAALAIPATIALAQGKDGNERKQRHQAHAFVVLASTEGKCATCVFWGGQRHVTSNKTAVHVLSLGMCNNPASPNYHKTTSPDTGPMKHWARWPALG